jgi:hypothetical protein
MIYISSLPILGNSKSSTSSGCMTQTDFGDILPASLWPADTVQLPVLLYIGGSTAEMGYIEISSFGVIQLCRHGHWPFPTSTDMGYASVAGNYRAAL